MTIDEAIKRIENHMEAHKIGEYPHIQLKEALDMAITALRAQTDFNGTYVNIEWLKQVEAERDALKNAKLDRSLWKGCKTCKGERSFTARHKVPFCPMCGRPTTEEAWAELGRRMNGGKTDN